MKQHTAHLWKCKLATAFVLCPFITLPLLAQNQPLGAPESTATRTETDTVTISGKVASIHENAVILMTDQDTQRQHTVPVNATITLNGKEVKLQDLRQGDGVAITVRENAPAIALRVDATRVTAQQPQQPRVMQQPGVKVEPQPTATTEKPHAWLGVVLGESTDPGAQISQIYPAGPAARAGLRSGDAIVRINNERVESPQTIVQKLQEMEPNSQVNVTVLRNGVEQEFAVNSGSTEWFQPREVETESQFDDDDFPEHAMVLEQQRRLGEQNERLERLVLELAKEVRQLRQEVSKLTNTPATVQEPVQRVIPDAVPER